jgi:glycine/D-amino acid oxidase-like deaminating enzyme
VHFQTESVWWNTLNAAERQSLSDLPQQTLDLRPDVLVIGGGIVGLATAYFAAEKGWKVQVITGSARLAEDAEGSLGCIFPNATRWQLSPVAQQLAQSSRDWWARLAVRPDFQVDWRVSGAVSVDERHLTPDPRTKMLELLEEGYSVRDVDAEQVAILEPQLRTLPAGGLQFPSEAVLHPLKAAVGFVRGTRRLNGRIAGNCTIQGLERQGDRIVAVETSSGRIEPRLVIIDQFEGLPDSARDSDLQTAAGEVSERRNFVATEPIAPLINRPVLSREWLVQLKSGEMVVEAIAPNPSAASQSDQELASLVNSAVSLLPALQSVPFVRAWSAISSTNANRLPQIDCVSNLTNAWTYQDLCGFQVMLAPIIGRTLLQWMDSNIRPEELVPFAKVCSH